MTLRPLGERIKGALRALLGWLGAIAFMAVGVFGSCIVVGRGSNEQGPDVIAVDFKDSRHVRLAEPLLVAWRAAGHSDLPALYVVESSDLNAASLGSGLFLVWDGVADLPEREITAILAHEVAHDALKHPRKSAELRDLTDFFAEILATLTGSDPSVDETLKDWVGKATTSKYNQRQELAADELAVKLLAESGFGTPQVVLADALSSLLRVHGDTGGGWFDTHPATSERIRLLREGAPAE